MKSNLLILSLAASLFTLSVMASACGGGDDELKQALESLGDNDLAIMVLPQEQLGDEFSDLGVSEDSGFQDNEGRADDTIDPDDTADDLERAGRTNGYGLTYSDPALSALDAGEGVISVGTEVELFQDGSAASDFLNKQVDDLQRLEGEEIEAGVTLEEVETFAVDGLADEAIGLREQVSFSDLEMFGTLVVFRLDRLVGVATLATADDADTNSQVEEIARALEGRIEGVLLGEITGTPVPIITGSPVPIPEADEEGATVPRPEGAPDLEAMALSLDDLPSGVSIDREGYVEDEDTVASYEREFDLGETPIGASRFISLENDLDLHEGSSEAAVIFTTFEALFTGETAEEFFASAISEGGAFEASDIRPAPVVLPDLGDDAFAVRVSFDTPLGSFESVFVFVRTDRAVGSLILTASAGELDVTDVVLLAEAMTERMEAGLAAAGGEAAEAALVPQEAVGVAEGFLQPFGLAGALQPLGDPADLSLTEGGPLEDLMLSSEDVPPGYQELLAGSSSFETEPSFGEPSPGEVTMSMSMFADEDEQHIIMSTVMQAEDEAVLQEALAEIRGMDFAEIEEAFSAFELFGIEMTNVRLVDASGLGDSGFGFGYTMDFSALMEELGEGFGEEPLDEEAPEFSAMDMEIVMFMDGSLAGVVVTFALDDAAPASRPLADIMAAKMTVAS